MASSQPALTDAKAIFRQVTGTGVRGIQSLTPVSWFFTQRQTFINSQGSWIERA